MKYRRKPVVVEVVQLNGMMGLRKEPDGPLHARSEEEPKRDLERVPDEWLVGCSCPFNVSRGIVPSDLGIVHTGSCRLRGH